MAFPILTEVLFGAAEKHEIPREITEFNELSQHSPTERMPWDILTALSDAWGLNARADPFWPCSWLPGAVAALERAVLPTCHLWQCIFFSGPSRFSPLMMRSRPCLQKSVSES